MRKTGIVVLLILTLVMLTGCLPGDGRASEVSPANFLWGIWHGWMAPLSLIVSIFAKNIRLYEIHNTGIWYDFGFYMAILGGFGGLSTTRKKKKKDVN
ncbi:hypothetical protein EXM22_01620 [Oceanispirochaeta crateris]|uniref:Lipoprotein n=1 Tax=Oceanispirochaeta crateris TaxID=2518645 RepID=A0A5C1QKT5_9SPIO|nr:hypothetical protein [Oceanispirochaeta crateris]QEN06752.1 hypothetical protein EXM22_01620 [Oceanispirochaeta crateris]